MSLVTTVYKRVEVPVTRYVVRHYRIVSHYATKLTVDYYDSEGTFWTRISYPTRYLKNVVTELVEVKERVERPGAVVPVDTATEEKVGVRVAT
jgi:hypothetical protein